MTWQILGTMAGAMFTGMLLMLLAVIVGGWLVWKAKTITMPMPFVGGLKRSKDEPPYSYAPDMGEDYSDAHMFDEELSPAAARLREQKTEPTDEKGRVLSVVKGKDK